MKIKKSFRWLSVMVLILSVASSSAFAQNRQHNVSLSYGFLTLDQVSDIFEEIIEVTVTFGLFGKKNMSFSGAAFRTYHFFPGGKRFGFGPAVGIYTTTGDLLQGGVQAGTFEEPNYIVAGELAYYWVVNKTFQLYSVAGIGLRFRPGDYAGFTDSDIDSTTFITFNLQALGFRFGKTIGFFGELGIGYKGGIVFGLDAQF